MKSVFYGIVSAFSMFSRIPMPRIEWNDRTRRLTLAFFPLVGAVIGAALCGLYYLCAFLGVNALFFASFAVFVSAFITGGIHLDGYCDTCDSLAAHTDRECRMRIMKDHHIGAFSATALMLVLILQLGAWSELYSFGALIPCAALIFVFSRALAGVSLLRCGSADPEGLGAAFKVSAARGTLPALFAVIAVITVFAAFVSFPAGPAVPVVALAVYFFFIRLTARKFGGISGDLAGYLITLSETACLVLLAASAAVFRVV